MAKKKAKKKDSQRVETDDAAKIGDKLSRKEFESELYKLQVELCKVQDWVKAAGEKIIVIFEGRDAAGKGGVIKRITERVSPRVFRVEWSRCRPRMIGRKPNGICRGTSPTCPPPAKLRCSIAAGTIGPGSSM